VTTMSTPNYIKLLLYNYQSKSIAVNFNINPERIEKFVVEIPIPLRHLLCLESSFEIPNTDENGCFTWPLDYGMTLSDFTNIIFFLENGKSPFVFDNPVTLSRECRLSDFFTIFGGCHEYDKYRLSNLKKREDIQKMATPDPFNPQSIDEDIHHIFHWTCCYQKLSDDWDFVTQSSSSYRTWRKAKTIEEITVEKEARDFVRNQRQSELDNVDE